jgi:DNA-binding CsgD family transcriptional regulator/PAS domain-containing protein
MTATTAFHQPPGTTGARPLALGRSHASSDAEARATDTEKLSSLIGDIYDAALDPSLWSGVLHRARQLVGGSAAAMFVRDTAARRLEAYYDDGGLDPHYSRLYVEQYAALDPFAAVQVSAAIEAPVSTSELLPHEEFLETRLYREWARPQGLVDLVCAVLDMQATRAAMFVIFRHARDGLADAETRRRMRLIVPHVRRAVATARILDCKIAESAAFADALDGLAVGLFLVDEVGRIVHANASGRALLDARSVLRTSAGRLVANEVGTSLALGELFARAGRQAAPAGRGIAVALRARDGDHYVAHVLPLASANRSCIGRSPASAAVFVHKAALEAGFPPEAFARLYGLTPGELRVLTAIVEVGGVPEVAEALGIGEATVKTHLHRVFGKTGAARQADLVKLVAAFGSPVLAAAGHPAPTPGRSATGREAARRLASRGPADGLLRAQPGGAAPLPSRAGVCEPLPSVLCATDAPSQ